MNGYNTPGDNPKNERRKGSEGSKSVAFKKGGKAHHKKGGKHHEHHDKSSMEHHKKGGSTGSNHGAGDTTHFTTVKKKGQMGKVHTHEPSKLAKGHTFHASSGESGSMMNGAGACGND